VVGAPSVLARRAAAAGALLAALVPYYVWQRSLPRLGTWGDIAFVSCVLMPLVFGLVWVALPLRRAVGLLPVGAAALVLGIVFEKAGVPIAGNFVKLAATSALAFGFLTLFESVSWVVLVALIVPWVDAASVWKGPTHHIVHHQQHLFTTLSFAFPVPGEHGSANLGLPDLFFFALFLAAAVRWHLRGRLTWLTLVVSFGVTLALTVWWGLAGLPALPGLSLGFLVPNADLVWRAFQRERAAS
jgi:hypothetical protein